jgi:hypothetical protein
MPIIATAKASTASSEKTSQSAHARVAWSILGVLGAAFVLMGLTDIVLGIYPPSIGNPEWEFGVVSSILNGFAIPTMGGYLLLASLVARGKLTAARVVSILAIIVAFLLAVMGLLYLTVVPMALKSVAANPVLALGMKKAMVKGVLFLLAYVVLFLYAGLRGLRGSKQS